MFEERVIWQQSGQAWNSLARAAKNEKKKLFIVVVVVVVVGEGDGVGGWSGMG